MALDSMKSGTNDQGDWETMEGPEGKFPVDHFFATFAQASRTRNVQAEVKGVMVRLPKGADQDTIDKAIKDWRSAYEEKLRNAQE